MITLKEMNKEDVLTVDSLKEGDTFTILLEEWDSVYLMTDDEIYVDVTTGFTYSAYEYSALPIHKVDFVLTQV